MNPVLSEMQADPGFAIYRLYALDEDTARLRAATDLRDFAGRVLGPFDGRPNGVTADSVSVKPNALPFGDETTIGTASADEPG